MNIITDTIKNKTKIKERIHQRYAHYKTYSGIKYPSVMKIIMGGVTLGGITIKALDFNIDVDYAMQQYPFFSILDSAIIRIRKLEKEKGRPLNTSQDFFEEKNKLWRNPTK